MSLHHGESVQLSKKYLNSLPLSTLVELIVKGIVNRFLVADNNLFD